MSVPVPHAAHPKRGFTLMELVVIMALIGIIAGIAGPRIDLAKYRLDSAALELSTGLHGAQQTALLRGHNVNFVFEPGLNRMILHLDADNDKLAGSSESQRVIEFGEGVVFGRGGAPALNGVTNDISFTETWGSGSPVVRFYRNGSTSEAGTVYITSKQAQLGSTYAEHSRAIQIERATGRIRCFSYKSGSWQEKC